MKINVEIFEDGKYIETVEAHILEFTELSERKQQEYFAYCETYKSKMDEKS